MNEGFQTKQQRVVRIRYRMMFRPKNNQTHTVQDDKDWTIPFSTEMVLDWTRGVE